MNHNEREIDVPNVKVACVYHFQKCGYRVLAMLDNEPDNLNSISKADPEGEILLLHANTIFESKRNRLPEGTVKGKVHDITELIEEKKLPQHIQFVWHGVNDESNLKQFLGSKIKWAECDARFNPKKNDVILRHDSFHESTHNEKEEFMFLRDVINPIKFIGKSLKLDFKENGALVDKVLTLLNAHGIENKTYDLTGILIG